MTATHQHLGLRFWGLWTATGASRFGDGLVTVAMPLLAASITSDGLQVSAMLAALRLPWLIFALPFGALADRVDRRRLAVMTETARLVLLAIFAVVVASNVRHLYVLYAFALAMGTFEVLSFAATASAVPDLVTAGSLPVANGHLSVIDRACADFLGVGVGGLVFAWLVAAPFFFDSVSFGVSALILLMVLPGPMGSNPRHSRVRGSGVDASGGERQSLSKSIEEGLRYVRGNPPLRLLAWTICMLAVCQTVVAGLLVLYGLRTLHLSRSGYGLFVGFAASGAIVGGLIASRVIARIGKPSVLVVGAFLAGLSYVVLAATTSVALAFVALFLEIFGISVGNVASVSIRHERIPSRMMGRAGTAFRMVAFGSVPIGALVGGVVAHIWTPRTAILAAGIVQVVATVLLAPRIRRLLADPVVAIEGTRNPGELEGEVALEGVGAG